MAANRVRASGAATGGAALVSAVGPTPTTLALASQAAGAVSLRTNGTVDNSERSTSRARSTSSRRQAQPLARWRFPPKGSDTNIPLTISTKGTGVLICARAAPWCSCGWRMSRARCASSRASGAATGGAPVLAAKGQRHQRRPGARLASQGTGAVQLRTNGTVVQLEAAHVANAANYGRVAGGATGAGVTFSIRRGPTATSTGR